MIGKASLKNKNPGVNGLMPATIIIDTKNNRHVQEFFYTTEIILNEKKYLLINAYTSFYFRSTV